MEENEAGVGLVPRCGGGRCPGVTVRFLRRRRGPLWPWIRPVEVEELRHGGGGGARDLESDPNHVFISCGELHILPPSLFPETPSQDTALAAIHDDSIDTRARRRPGGRSARTGRDAGGAPLEAQPGRIGARRGELLTTLVRRTDEGKASPLGGARRRNDQPSIGASFFHPQEKGTEGGFGCP
jgi:hypothetical protein